MDVLKSRFWLSIQTQLPSNMISSHMLKSTADSISSSLAHLFNWSLHLGKFPRNGRDLMWPPFLKQLILNLCLSIDWSCCSHFHPSYLSISFMTDCWTIYPRTLCSLTGNLVFIQAVLCLKCSLLLQQTGTSTSTTNPTSLPSFSTCLRPLILFPIKVYFNLLPTLVSLVLSSSGLRVTSQEGSSAWCSIVHHLFPPRCATELNLGPSTFSVYIDQLITVELSV